MKVGSGRMTEGTVLVPCREGMDECVIIKAPTPPELWTVRYRSGANRRWSKTHLRKYYKVKEVKDES